jgi:hypothetical protein
LKSFFFDQLLQLPLCFDFVTIHFAAPPGGGIDRKSTVNRKSTPLAYLHLIKWITFFVFSPPIPQFRLEVIRTGLGAMFGEIHTLVLSQ